MTTAAGRAAKGRTRDRKAFTSWGRGRPRACRRRGSQPRAWRWGTPRAAAQGEGQGGGRRGEVNTWSRRTTGRQAKRQVRPSWPTLGVCKITKREWATLKGRHTRCSLGGCGVPLTDHDRAVAHLLGGAGRGGHGLLGVLLAGLHGRARGERRRRGVSFGRNDGDRIGAAGRRGAGVRGC